jgi:hypothetical protein
MSRHMPDFPVSLRLRSRNDLARRFRPEELAMTRGSAVAGRFAACAFLSNSDGDVLIWYGPLQRNYGPTCRQFRAIDGNRFDALSVHFGMGTSHDFDGMPAISFVR